MSDIPESTDIYTLKETLLQIWRDKAKKPLRYFPADFIGSTEDPFAIPFPEETSWKTLAFYADLLGITKGAMLIAPLYWQTEPIFWDAMHARGIPMSVMHSGNIPLAREVIKQAKFEMVVMDRNLFDTVYEDLQNNEALADIKIMITFSPVALAKDSAPRRASSVLTLHEYHLIPGCPLLYQRPGEAGTNHFRVYEDFLVEVTSEGTFVAAAGTNPFSLPRIRLPISLKSVSESNLYSII